MAERTSGGSRSGYRRDSRSSQKSYGSRYTGKKAGIALPAASSYSRRQKKRKKQMRRRMFLFLFLCLIVFGIGGVIGWNIYERKNPAIQSTVDLQGLASPDAVLIDRQTGQILAAQNENEKIYPASMAKIMTVYTALGELKDLNETVTMSADFYQELYDRDASRAGFEPGETARVIDLMYGALLPSGAECCKQLAILGAGSEEAFAEKMNEKAAKMGLTQTHFANATGLHSEEQYSTAEEIGRILREALKNDTFYQIITTPYYTVPASEVHPDGFTFWSTLFKNIEDSSVPGGKIMGGKTGFTNEAGNCLASFASVDGYDYILVTAGLSQNGETGHYHIEDAFRVYDQIQSCVQRA